MFKCHLAAHLAPRNDGQPCHALESTPLVSRVDDEVTSTLRQSPMISWRRFALNLGPWMITLTKGHHQCMETNTMVYHAACVAPLTPLGSRVAPRWDALQSMRPLSFI